MWRECSNRGAGRQLIGAAVVIPEGKPKGGTGTSIPVQEEHSFRKIQEPVLSVRLDVSPVPCPKTR
jgi:hypothetical protein